MAEKPRALRQRAQRQCALRQWRNRTLALETCESRLMLAADLDLATQRIALDCNADGLVSPQDITAIVRELRQNGSRPVNAQLGLRMMDANLDDRVNMQDAVRVLRHVAQDGSSRIDVREILDASLPDLTEAQRERLQRAFGDLNQQRRHADLSPRDMARALDGFTRLGQLGSNAMPESSFALDESHDGCLHDILAQLPTPGDLAAKLGGLLGSLPIDESELRGLLESWQGVVEDSDPAVLQQVCDELWGFVTSLPDNGPGGDGSYEEDPGGDGSYEEDPGGDNSYEEDPGGDGSYEEDQVPPDDPTNSDGDDPDGGNPDGTIETEIMPPVFEIPPELFEEYDDLVERFTTEPISLESMHAMLMEIHRLICPGVPLGDDIVTILPVMDMVFEAFDARPGMADHPSADLLAVREGVHGFPMMGAISTWRDLVNAR